MSGTDPVPTRKDAITRIRTALIEKKLTQAELADCADCHEKTIQNLLAGRSVRDQTLFDVCMVLDLPFEKLKAEWSGDTTLYDVPTDVPGQPAPGTDVAPVYMGAYTRPAVDHIVGTYLTIRPAFAVADMIVAYRTEIDWDPSWPSLVFQESDRPDAIYAHRGRVHVPASSMFIHLVSLTKGAMRMVTLSKLDQIGEMRGVIATVSRHGAHAVPVAAPIVYIKQEAIETHACGHFDRSHPLYATYQTHLDACTNEGFARLVP